MKQKCAEIAYDMIQDGMIVGLGGGSTVALLIELLQKKPKEIQVVTPSQDTMELCLESRLPVISLEEIDQVDIAFDGCDEVDAQFCALKSCGGIHTKEKIVAAMASNYVLLADEKKYFDILPFGYPVTLEVVRSAKSYVKKKLIALGAEVTERRADQKAGLVISDDGNYLMEARFSQVKDAVALDVTLDHIPGIVEHGLFTDVVSKVIVAGQDGYKVVDRG